MTDKKVKILAFAGSTREGSFNKKLIKIAEAGAEQAGAEVTHIDLRDFHLPLYDGDLEAGQGLPENALKLKKIFESHDGFLIASPEYNSGYSGVLKNAIDWVSRPATKDEPSLKAFDGKTASIMSASPGALGGLRGLYQLREMLLNINVTVLPRMQAINRAHEAFDESGNLKDSAMRNTVMGLGAQTVRALEKAAV